MGRTLHYTIAKDDCRPFTEAEYDRIMLTNTVRCFTYPMAYD